AAPVVELSECAYWTHVSFLDEVEEGQAALEVFLRDGDDEAQVRLYHLGLGVLDASLGFGDGDVEAVEGVGRQLRLLFDAPALRALADGATPTVVLEPVHQLRDGGLADRFLLGPLAARRPRHHPRQ